MKELSPELQKLAMTDATFHYLYKLYTLGQITWDEFLERAVLQLGSEKAFLQQELIRQIDLAVSPKIVYIKGEKKK